MNVCNLLTGSGGWPLTILLTSDKKPFFAGTYFPKENRFGRIGMKELVSKIKEAWQNQHDEIIKSSDEITSALKPEAVINNDELDKSVFEKAYDEFLKKYDSTYGGFGNSPKFPSPHNLQFLLRYYKRNDDKFALEMVENTLINMRNGGIFDHLGYGFHRYSTDRKWRIPHFEKMLYDQASAAIAYIETYQAAGKEIYRKTAEEIFEYVLRDMKSPEGVFYSAEDADSEGIEGKFYLWRKNELMEYLTMDEFNLISSVYDIEEEGNWIDPVHGDKNGTNILYFSALPDTDLKSVHDKLFRIRESRIHPFKDDKILTDWNAFMISALAKGGAVFNEKKYKDAAETAVQFILNKMFTNDGILLHRYRDGEAAITGNLDDYAFLVQALLDLYESVFNPDYLLKAIELTGIVLEIFRDNETGGFFFSSGKDDELIIRQKEIYDGAVPSGNSVMMLNLLRLSRFTGRTEYETEADNCFKTFAHIIKKVPSAFCNSLNALDFALNKTFEIVIVPGNDNESAYEIINEINKKFVPGKVMLLNSGRFQEKLLKISPFTENQIPQGDKTAIYICTGFVCSSPVNNADDALNMLN